MLARAALVVVGGVVAFHAAVVHRHHGAVVGVDVPWGLALALAATLTAAWAAAALVRSGAAWFGLGWVALVLAQQSLRPGSYLVAGDTVGWAFMGLGLLAVAGVVVRHPGPAVGGRARPRDGRGDERRPPAN